MDKIAEKLDMIIRGGAVKRFHTFPTIQQETVGHHSFNVAWLCWLLTEGAPTAELLAAALSHDLAEHEIGDIPAPTKLALGLSEEAAKLEERLLNDVGLHFPLTKAGERILKMADILSGIMFCRQEYRMGDKSALVIYERYCKYLRKLLPFSEHEKSVITNLTNW